MSLCQLDADTLSTLFVVAFLLGMAALAIVAANRRGPAEELHEPINRWWE